VSEWGAHTDQKGAVVQLDLHQPKQQFVVVCSPCVDLSSFHAWTFHPCKQRATRAMVSTALSLALFYDDRGFSRFHGVVPVLHFTLCSSRFHLFSQLFSHCQTAATACCDVIHHPISQGSTKPKLFHRIATHSARRNLISSLQRCVCRLLPGHHRTTRRNYTPAPDPRLGRALCDHGRVEAVFA
jgi:hypothetical protein